MPVLMTIAEGLYLRTGRLVYLELAKRWARGSAILFAVGAVSGTVLSFELGLLWPKFMEKAGAIIGMPFSLEGFAFFTEAIFLGVFLAGWSLAQYPNLVIPDVTLLNAAAPFATLRPSDHRALSRRSSAAPLARLFVLSFQRAERKVSVTPAPLDHGAVGFQHKF